MSFDRSTVGVVLLAYGDSDTWRQLGESINNTRGLGVGSVVGVLNPSTRVGHQTVGDQSAGVLVMPRNAGYAAALNAGITNLNVQGSTAEYVLVMTQDCEPTGAIVDGLLAVMADPEVAAAGPSLRFRGSGGVSFGGFCERSGRIDHHHHAVDSNKIDWLDGACVLIRRSMLDRIGPLPEDLFLYFEDVLLGLRIRQRGGTLACNADLVVEQDSGRRGRPVAFGYFDCRNRLLLASLTNEVSLSRQITICVVRIITAAALSVIPFPERRPTRFRQRRLFIGRVAGLVDGVRGRSGPPPPWVRQCSGIANT